MGGEREKIQPRGEVGWGEVESFPLPSQGSTSPASQAVTPEKRKGRDVCDFFFFKKHQKHTAIVDSSYVEARREKSSALS